MKATKQSGCARLAPWYAAPEYSIMIVCDSAKNGEFAFHACHRLINLANKDFLFHVVICSLADFSDADTWRLRRIETEQTSMVIVATETTPPTAFWQWLRCWAIQPHPGPIGVYILGAETPVLFREHLMNFCEAAQIPLLEQPMPAGAPERPLLAFGNRLRASL